MNKRSQQGSAHAVIVVVLVLALLAALAWIFYQNFIEKDPASTKTDVSAEEKDTTKKPDSSLTKSTTAAVENYKVTLQYPDTWTGKKDGEGSTGTLSSPNGDIEISYAVVKPPVFGASCGDTVTIKSLDKSSLAKFSKDASFVSMTMSTETDNLYYFGAMSNQTLADLKVGETACNATNVVALSSKPFVFTNVHATFKNIQKDSTQQEIEQVLKDDDAQVARSIISSLSDSNN